MAFHDLHISAPACLRAFYPLLQKGFRVSITPQGTIRDLLAKCCGRADGCELQQIETIFLNGMPVDEPDQVILSDGDTLALSAALPGLVGATMRSGGLLAGFRQSITYHSGEHAERRGGLVRIKLFNLLMPSLGPGFLEHGVVLDIPEMHSLATDLIAICGPAVHAVYNAEPIALESLISRAWPAAEALTRLTAEFL